METVLWFILYGVAYVSFIGLVVYSCTEQVARLVLKAGALLGVLLSAFVIFR